MSKQEFQPCQQKWEQMPIKNGERWCKHCSQCVIDFRTSEIPEIQKKYAGNSNRVCGIYTKNQITQLYPKTSIVYPNRRKLKNIIATVLACFSINSGAQDLPSLKTESDKLAIPVMDMYHYPRHFQRFNPALVAVSQDSIKISGIIKDSTTLKPLIGASIWLKNTEKGAISNIEGFYEFAFSPTEGDSLVVSYFGYENSSFQIASFASKGFDIYLTPKSDLDTCVVGGIPPRYKIWQKGFWKKLRHQEIIK